MGIYINTGNEGFQSARNSEYVDKSGLIAVVNDTLFSEARFTCVRNISERQRALLAEWDIEPDDFKGIVSDYNERMQSKMVSQNRRKPEHDEAAGGRRKPGRRKKASATDQPDNEG